MEKVARTNVKREEKGRRGRLAEKYLKREELSLVSLRKREERKKEGKKERRKGRKERKEDEKDGGEEGRVRKRETEKERVGERERERVCVWSTGLGLRNDACTSLQVRR